MLLLLNIIDVGEKIWCILSGKWWFRYLFHLAKNQEIHNKEIYRNILNFIEFIKHYQES